MRSFFAAVADALESMGGWISDHWSAALGIALTAVPVLAGTLRVLRFSNWDPTVLAVVSRNLNLPAIALATLVPVLFMVLAVIISVYVRGVIARRLGVLPSVLRVVVVISLSLVVLPLPFVVIMVLATAVLVRDVRTGRRTPEDLADQREPFGIYLIGIVYLLVWALFVMPSAWLPKEVITVKDERMVGYVLEAGDHDLTLVRLDGVPLIVRQDDVAKRVLCSDGPRGIAVRLLWEPISTAFAASPSDSMPRCSRLKQGGS